jgi:hypothetical protein
MFPMSNTGSGFTPLERAVLRAICEKDSVDRAALQAQLSAATVIRRENTAAGFYTQIAIQHGSLVSVGGERRRHGPTAAVEGLKHGMGFILWLKEGFLDCLEGFCYDESTTGINFDRVNFELGLG